MRMVVALEYNPVTDDDVPQILNDVLDAVATSPTKQTGTYVALAETSWAEAKSAGSVTP